MAPHRLAIAKQSAIGFDVTRIHDQQDVPAPRQYHRGERVIDHRLVVDRQEPSLPATPAAGVEPRAAAAREYDAFIPAM